MIRQLQVLLKPHIIIVSLTFIYLMILLRTAGGDPLTFVRIGTKFTEQDSQGNPGYDGQFYYYIAANPAEGWQYIDVPAYRYQRIFYPMLARTLSLGNEHLLPWTMLLVNLFALTGSIWIVEILLMEQGISRWYALGLGLFAGLIYPVTTSLAEPLALCLILLAILFFERGRWLWCAILFVLAALTKETSLIVVAGYIIFLASQRHFKWSLAMAIITGGPFGLYQLLLLAWLGSFGVGAGGGGATPFQLIPFGSLGDVAKISWGAFWLFVIFLTPIIILPTLWAIFITGRDIWQGKRHPWAFALFLYALVIPFLPLSTFIDPTAIPRFAGPLVALIILYAALRNYNFVLNSSLLWVITVLLVPFL